MKKISILLIVILSFIACDKKQPKYNLFVEGKISDLKLGTIYLQAFRDSTIVNIDSASFNGENEYFKLKTHLKEPELMLLLLKKHNNDDYMEVINFFAEEGKFEVDAKVTDFTKAQISTSSENQEKLEEIKKAIKHFNDEDLDLIKEEFDLKDQNKSLEAFERKKKSMERRRYLYMVNFALNNKHLEIAPFTILSEATDLNIKYLDTIYNSLDENIKYSRYGEELSQLIELRKEQLKESETQILQKELSEEPST